MAGGSEPPVKEREVDEEPTARASAAVVAEWRRRVEAEYRSAAHTQHLTLWLIQAAVSPATVTVPTSGQAGQGGVPSGAEVVHGPPRKRAVRSPVPPWNSRDGRVDFAASTSLNPRDAASRTVYARADGHCYVQLPPPPGKPIGPPGSALPTEVVDCPDAMQQPAWDTCLDGDLTRLGAGDCVCARSGNPPPPPMDAECPSED